MALITYDFWNGLTINQLAERQAVSPIERLEDMFGDFWPVEDNIDEFIEEIYSRRH